MGDQKVFRAVIRFICAVSICFAGGVSADPSSKFSLGAAYINGNSIYTGVGSTSRFMPSIAYENDKVKIDFREGVSYKFIDTQTFGMRAAIAPNFRPYKSADSTSLSGMDRKMTFDGVIMGSFDIVRGSTLKLKMAREVTNEFNGTLVDLAFSQFIPIGGQPVIVSLGSKNYDRKRAEYFFGVKPSEATGSRAAYAPGAAAITYLSVNTFFNITSNIGAFANITTNLLPSKIKDSPIVSKSSNTAAILGVAYNF